MSRTASEAGWHVSRYNLLAKIHGKEQAAIANLFKGTCGVYSPVELFLLDELPTLDEGHPIIKRFADRGLIVNFDERMALETMGRMACAVGGSVGITICPTMGCNFDCPYCFENHKSGKMTSDTQDEVISLAKRMMEAFRAKSLYITWFGGEPLLALDVIEALSARLIALSGEFDAKFQASIITNGYFLTQEAADTLEKCRVKSAQITLDGIGEKHDRTRRLAGGGPTFDRITENLRTVKLSFEVQIRHNVHAENKADIEALKAFTETLAKESGNRIRYYPALVTGNDTFSERGENVRLLCGTDASEIGIAREANRFTAGRGHYCMAHTLSSIGIDEKGRLHKCWEDVDKPEHSFGTAARWDPKDPIGTADDPDKLLCYLTTAVPNGDPECRGCVWLPVCAGGCPNKRVYYSRECLTFRDEPEKYVLALYDRLQREKKEKAERETKEEDKHE